MLLSAASTQIQNLKPCLTTIAQACRRHWKSQSALFCTEYGNGCSKRKAPTTQIQTSSIASQKVTLYDVTLITNKGWPHSLHSITHTCYTLSSYHSWSISQALKIPICTFLYRIRHWMFRHTCYTMSSYHSWSIPNLHFSVQDTGMDVPSAGFG